MKTINRIIIATAIITALANSCTKAVQDIPATSEETITMIVNAAGEDKSPESSKTYLDGTGIKWSSTGEKIKMYQAATTSGTTVITNATSNVGTSTDSYATMSFPVTFASAEADNFTYYASYPSTSWVSSNQTIAKANLETPSTQTPTATSFDRSADLLIAKPFDNGNVQPTELNMQFARVIAIGKMTITNLPSDEVVQKVTFSANNGSAVNIAGRTTFDLATAEPLTAYADQQAATSIDIVTASLNETANNSMVVYFTCYPFELSEGNTFTVKVEATSHVYTRTVTIPVGRTLNFVAGKASGFSVDMSSAIEEEATSWILYNSEITSGDYLIVDGGKAMVAEVESNRLILTTVTATDGIIHSNRGDIIWHINKIDNYCTIYNTATSKYVASTGVKSQAALVDENSNDYTLWGISVNDNTIVNKYNNSHSVNASLRNGGTAFACYATIQNPSVLFYKKDTRVALNAPASVTATLNSSNNLAIDVQFSAVDNAGSYTVVATPTSGNTVQKTGVTETSTTIENLAAETEYTISVFAVPSDPSAYLNSAATEAASTVTTGSLPTPSNGTSIWSEDFSGWSSLEDSASGSNIYGGGTVTYAYSSGSSYQNQNLSGGETPELLVGKGNGTFTISDIPITGATAVSLTFKSNHSEYCDVSSTAGTPAKVSESGNTVTWAITGIPNNTNTIDLTITNTNSSSNCRVDDFVLIAGSKNVQTLSFDNASVSWTIGTDCTLNTAKNGQTVSGAQTTVTYSSSDQTVATINSSTGAITPLKAGTTTITATAAETDAYWGNSATYLLTIASSGGGGGSSTVTYTVTGTSSVGVSGTAPSGSSATYSQTYGTVNQMTSGNSITLTLSGYAGKRITGASVSVKSNSKGGGGSLSLTSNGSTIASITDSKFNTAAWNGSWSTSYVDKTLSVTQTTIGSGKTIVLTISATANSLYFESLTLTYE